MSNVVKYALGCEPVVGSLSTTKKRDYRVTNRLQEGKRPLYAVVFNFIDSRYFNVFATVGGNRVCTLDRLVPEKFLRKQLIVVCVDPFFLTMVVFIKVEAFQFFLAYLSLLMFILALVSTCSMWWVGTFTF